MGRTKGFSSSRLRRDDHDEEEHQEENLSLTYQVRFSILSHIEGDRFTSLKFREIISYKYIPNSLLQDVGMYDSFNQLLINYGLKIFISMLEPIYIELTAKFYTSLEVNHNDSYILKFRLLGKNHQLTYSFMQRVFVFKMDGKCNMPIF